MKRYDDLYKNIYKFENILTCYNEIIRNTKNKNMVNKYKIYKCINITKIYNDLKNRNYKVGKFNIFYIYEPKKRRIVSQNMYDKLINHLVSRYILYPSIMPCLIDANCASRPNKGTKYALNLYFKYRNYMYYKYKKYYILKCDIKNYFGSIDIDIFKMKINNKIKDKEALKIIYNILDSDVNLSIGFMTSQILGVYYLNDLDHYIKEDLKIKCYVRYQDDFILFSNNKDYLKRCLEKIIIFLKKEKLVLNDKTRIYSNKNNIIFLGKDKYNKKSKYRDKNRKIKLKKYLYENNKINLNSYLSTYISLH